MNEWISVKTNLPDTYTNVLICDANGITADEREPEIAHLDEDDGEFIWVVICPFNFRRYTERKPTHWMPLPEPPKESAE